MPSEDASANAWKTPVWADIRTGLLRMITVTCDTMKIAIFTTERHDNAETTSRLRHHAQEQGWETVEYRDTKLGRRSDHAALDRCLNDGRAGKIQGFLCWSINRLASEGVGKVMSILARFVEHELPFRFLHDGVDSFGGDNAVVGLIASISCMEANLRSQRIKDGMAFSRGKNIHCGRRKLNLDAERIKAMREAGMSLKAIGDAQSPRLVFPLL
jgi:DNA invertase Pin-like site-specific DNA recombinase